MLPFSHEFNSYCYESHTALWCIVNFRSSHRWVSRLQSLGMWYCIGRQMGTISYKPICESTVLILKMTVILILMLQINWERFSTTASNCTPQCMQILPDSMVSIMLVIPLCFQRKTYKFDTSLCFLHLSILEPITKYHFFFQIHANITRFTPWKMHTCMLLSKKISFVSRLLIRTKYKVLSNDKELWKQGNHSYDTKRIIQLTQADEKMECYVLH